MKGFFLKKGLLKIAPLIVLVFCLATTGVLWNVARKITEEATDKHFQQNISIVTGLINTRLNNYLEILRGAQGLISVNNQATRQDWHIFSNITRYYQRYPGIDGLAFVQYVKKEQLMDFQDEMKKEFNDFTIWPLEDKEDYFILAFIEPYSLENQKGLGYDLGSDSKALEAMEYARETGIPITSDFINFVTNTVQEPGFIMVQPVYKNEMQAEGSDNLLGFVMAQFRVKGFMEGIFPNGLAANEVILQIYDQANEQLVFESANNIEDQKYKKKQVVGLYIDNKEWELHFYAMPNSDMHENIPLALLVIGTFISFLFFIIAWYQTACQKLAQNLAEKMTKELSESRELYRTMFESMSNGVAIYEEIDNGKDFIFIDFNRAGELLDNLNRNSLRGKRLSELFPQLEQERFIEVMNNVWRSGSPQSLSVPRYKNGKLVSWRENYIYKLPSGQIVTIYNDVTEQKKAEEKVKTYIEKLEVSNAELQEFIFIASHDLQEPLRKIRAFSERIMKEYYQCLDDRGRDYLHRMNNGAERMQYFLEDLLQLSRLSLKTNTFEKVHLGELIQEVLEGMEEEIYKTNGRIIVGLLPEINADKKQMTLLFNNLLSNALKFRKNDTPPFITIESKLNSHQEWEIKVTDNGIGFDEIYKERIFRPFERLHGHNLYPGSGMGLAMCRKIVTRHNGKIMAESSIGKGASFIITLPAKIDNNLEVV
ncbi:MAG: CHASE domain-containing protein [Bacillota bacterium]|nr:CHASE domain-containing protein [Bacillota bacterium]